MTDGIKVLIIALVLESSKGKGQVIIPPDILEEAQWRASVGGDAMVGKDNQGNTIVGLVRHRAGGDGAQL